MSYHVYDLERWTKHNNNNYYYYYYSFSPFQSFSRVKSFK